MAKTRRPPGRIRIIAGAFRGRRIPVPDMPGLRPTPDRVRETLFNWLAPHLPGSHCLDLFAGTGALALEAVSRGAARVVAVEQDAGLAARIRALAEAWQATALECVRADALSWLARNAREPFDIAFLDPPFGAGLLEPGLQALAEGRWLRPGGWVYLERPAASAFQPPASFEVHRESHAGDIAFGLYRPTGG